MHTSLHTDIERWLSYVPPFFSPQVGITIAGRTLLRPLYRRVAGELDIPCCRRFTMTGGRLGSTLELPCPRPIGPIKWGS